MPVIDANWTARQIKGEVEKLLSPTVCMRVLEELGRDNAGFDAIARVIQGDAFLSACLVALANAIQGDAHAPILSIPRALSVLGTRHTHMLVMSVLLSAAMLENNTVKRWPDVRKFVLALGAAGEWVGQRLGSDLVADDDRKERYLLGGLMLGLGPLVLLSGLDNFYAGILGSPVRIVGLNARENALLGVQRNQVCLWALEAMACPVTLVKWIASDMGSGQGELCSRSIEVIASMCTGGDAAEAEAFLFDALPRLGVNPEGLLADDLEALAQRIRVLESVFDFEASAPITPETRRSLTCDAGVAVGALLTDHLLMSRTMSMNQHHDAVREIAQEMAIRGADRDVLTGLLNRRGLMNRLSSLKEEAPSMVGLIVLDIDHFKQINDSRGHAAGDGVLKLVSDALRAHTPAPLLCARHGGDEFVAVFAASSLEYFRDVVTSLANTLRVRLGEQSVGVSIGGLLVESQTLCAQWEKCLNTADRRLYEAKAAGRNTEVIGY